MMQLTSELVHEYIGGQMEVQNPQEGYLFRGEIGQIDVIDDELRVRYAWLAKGEGYPPLPHRWVRADPKDYAASLEIYAASDIGHGRLCLQSPIVGELVVLFPPNGDGLDPARVVGLNI